MFHLYGFFIALGIISLYWLIELTTDKQIRKIYDHYLFSLLAVSLIFGRLYHVLANLKYYSQQPIEIITTWHGGLSIIGTLIGLIIELKIIAKKEKVPFLDLSRPLFLYLPIGQAIGRLGNIVNQELFGKPTKSIWGWFIPPAKRPLMYSNFSTFQPIPFYEIILDLLLFLFLYQLQKHKLNKLTIYFYLLGYSLIRIGLEFYRLPKDSFYLNIIDINLIIFIIFLVTSGISIYHQLKQ